MDYLFGVSFSNTAKLIYFLANYEIKQGDLVVAETPRGLELGKVISLPTTYEVKEGEEIPYSYITRLSNEEDIKIYKYNQELAKVCITTVQEEANKLNLNMKITTVDYTLDCSKLSISYLSDDRVDFRELLKVLASIYHCRIELRQIGPRDKAKMTGGIGICGLQLCCSNFLNEFDGISITMAKNQMLALNIPKLSGHCGKLICCLKYEDNTYSEEKKDLPKVGLRVKLNDVIYRIASINIITRVVRLEAPNSVQFVPVDDIKDKILYNYVPQNPNQIKPKPKNPNEGDNKKPNAPQRPQFNKRFSKNNNNNVEKKEVSNEEK